MEVVYEAATFVSIAEGDIQQLFDELDLFLGGMDDDDAAYMKQLRDALEEWLESDSA